MERKKWYFLDKEFLYKWLDKGVFEGIGGG